MNCSWLPGSLVVVAAVVIALPPAYCIVLISAHYTIHSGSIGIESPPRSDTKSDTIDTTAAHEIGLHVDGRTVHGRAGVSSRPEGSMDGDASFGHWLALRRKALRLSCVELARRVGCATVTLHKIEADERRPSEQIAAKLADQLNVAPQER